MNIDIIIDPDQSSVRLDSIICSRYEELSRNQAARMISAGKILVNGHQKKPGYRVKAGDQIKGSAVPFREPVDVRPEAVTLDVVFEDHHLIVINKKPGMVVHPAPGNQDGTLVNALIAHDPAIRRVGQDRSRSGIIHRLDKDTSGLMVVAKTSQALEFLQREFKQRRVQKKYLALVDGRMPDDSGKIEMPIGRHPVKRKQMTVNHQTGKYALSCWTVVKRYQTVTLVDVLLKTGRTHQIRVHFYAIDHPLIGDRIYQFRRNRKKQQMAPRQMLHAHQLSFRHPYSGRRIEFEAEPPDDFKAVIQHIEQKFP